MKKTSFFLCIVYTVEKYVDVVEINFTARMHFSLSKYDLIM